MAGLEPRRDTSGDLIQSAPGLDELITGMACEAPLTAWKTGVVAKSTTSWLLCPTCTQRAAKYSDSPETFIAAASSPDRKPFSIEDETTRHNREALARVRREIEEEKTTRKCAGCQRRVPLASVVCPHCDREEWGRVIGSFIGVSLLSAALAAGAVALHYHGKTHWVLTGPSIVLFYLVCRETYSDVQKILQSRQSRLHRDETDQNVTKEHSQPGH